MRPDLWAWLRSEAVGQWSLGVANRPDVSTVFGITLRFSDPEDAALFRLDWQDHCSSSKASRVTSA
jgi:hypothetical protein